MVADGELLEHAHVFGNFYGTPKAPVEETLAEEKTFSSTLTGKERNNWQAMTQPVTTL